MNYYVFGSIKGYMSTLLYEQGISKEDRSLFSSATVLHNLYENLGLKDIHIAAGIDVKPLVDEDQLEKINLYLMMKNKNFRIPESVIQKYQHKKDNVMSFAYTSEKDFVASMKEATNNPEYIIHKIQQKAAAEAKRKVVDVYGDIKDVDFSNKTYLAIDFEFIPNAIYKFSFNQITEIGLSYMDGDVIKTEHYIVNEHRERKSESKKQLQDSFNFGNSNFINTDDIIPILNDALCKSKNLVFHEHSCDIQYFEYNGLKLNNHRIYDTQMIHRNNFVAAGEPDHGKRLKDFLADNMITGRNMHNAGNDAHYTAMVFKSQVNEMLDHTKKSLKTQSLQL